MRSLETVFKSQGRSLRSNVAYQNGCVMVQLDQSFLQRAAVFVPCDSVESPITATGTAGGASPRASLMLVELKASA